MEDVKDVQKVEREGDDDDGGHEIAAREDGGGDKGESLSNVGQKPSSASTSNPAAAASSFLIEDILFQRPKVRKICPSQLSPYYSTFLFFHVQAFNPTTSAGSSGISPPVSQVGFGRPLGSSGDSDYGSLAASAAAAYFSPAAAAAAAAMIAASTSSNSDDPPRTTAAAAASSSSGSPIAASPPSPSSSVAPAFPTPFLHKPPQPPSNFFLSNGRNYNFRLSFVESTVRNCF